MIFFVDLENVPFVGRTQVDAEIGHAASVTLISRDIFNIYTEKHAYRARAYEVYVAVEKYGIASDP